MSKISSLALAATFLLSASVSASPYYPAQQGYSPYGQYGQYGQYGYRAQPVPQQRPAPKRINARNMGPEEMLTVGVDAVQAFLSTGDANNKQLALTFLREQVSSYFDFAYMSKWVAGRAWKSMDAGQRKDLEESIKNKFLNTLASGIGGYSESRVDVLSARQGSKSEVVVPINITNRNGNSMRMDFRFYRSAEGWKIFDVKAGGQSAVIYYRRHFQQMLRNMRQSAQSWR